MLLFQIASHLHMPVAELMYRVPLPEIFDWVRYFVELDRIRKRSERDHRRKGGTEIEIDPGDLAKQSPAQIAKIFGADVVGV